MDFRWPCVQSGHHDHTYNDVLTSNLPPVLFILIVGHFNQQKVIGRNNNSIIVRAITLLTWYFPSMKDWILHSYASFIQNIVITF